MLYHIFKFAPLIYVMHLKCITLILSMFMHYIFPQKIFEDFDTVYLYKLLRVIYS